MNSGIARSFSACGEFCPAIGNRRASLALCEREKVGLSFVEVHSGFQVLMTLRPSPITALARASELIRDSYALERQSFRIDHPLAGIEPPYPPGRAG
jgi:hypothetical protein